MEEILGLVRSLEKASEIMRAAPVAKHKALVLSYLNGSLGPSGYTFLVDVVPQVIGVYDVEVVVNKEDTGRIFYVHLLETMKSTEKMKVLAEHSSVFTAKRCSRHLLAAMLRV